jgi:hypothetical protein
VAGAPLKGFVEGFLLYLPPVLVHQVDREGPNLVALIGQGGTRDCLR